MGYSLRDDFNVQVDSAGSRWCRTGAVDLMPLDAYRTCLIAALHLHFLSGQCQPNWPPYHPAHINGASLVTIATPRDVVVAGCPSTHESDPLQAFSLHDRAAPRHHFSFAIQGSKAPRACKTTAMYPLPSAPYPTRALQADESNLLRLFTNTLTAAALHDYDCFTKDCHGDVSEDTRHDWKLVRRRQDLAVYRDATHPDDDIAVVEENGRISGQEPAPRGQILALLCIGTMPGTLDDVMYGVVTPTAEETMLKSSCIGDNTVDCCVLASIASPTPHDPWRSLMLKWSANAGPAAVRPFIRARDFTYVEGTGAATNVDGERVGYHIVHSVAVPDTQKTEDKEVVRGNVSLYHVFRQKSPNTVEVHIRAFWQLSGRMHAAVQSFSCVETTTAIARIRVYSQEKKLVQKSLSLDSAADPSCCGLCRRWVGGCFIVGKCCAVCNTVVCWRCSSSKRLGHLSPSNREVVAERQAGCRRCLRRSSQPARSRKTLLPRTISTVSTASLDSRRVCSSTQT
jgi:hypothetical protein